MLLETFSNSLPVLTNLAATGSFSRFWWLVAVAVAAVVGTGLWGLTAGREGKAGAPKPQRPNKLKDDASLVHRLEQWLGNTAVRFYHRPLATLLIVLIVSILSFVAARTLKLDTDLARLLPSSFESVQDLEKLKERYGGEGFLVVVGRDADPQALMRFVDDVTPVLAALPSVRYVETRRPTQFIRDHALYYLDTEDLATIRDRLEDRREWEVLHASPFYVDLLDSKPPSLDFTDIEQKYRKMGAGAYAFQKQQDLYYLDRQRSIIAILIKPHGLASNMQYAADLVSTVEGVLTRTDLKAYGPEMKVELTGRYKKRVDLQRQLARDLKVSSLVAQLLMLAYVALHFRRVTAIVLIFVPLLLGLLWTFGFTALVFRELGIDHGIHLLSRHQLECNGQQCGDAALHRTFSSIGRPVLIAAVTTIVAFAALGFSKFKAFYQFGTVAAMGLILVLIAYFVCMPALLGLAHRFGWRPKPLAAEGHSLHARFLVRKAPVVAVLFVILAGVAFTGIPKASFNYDFSALDDSDLPSYRLDGVVNEILGHSQTPLVVLAPNQEAARTYAAALRQRSEEYGGRSSVDFIVSSADLVPANQREKQPLLEEIGRVVDRFDPKKIPSEQLSLFHDIQRMARAEPFSSTELPAELVRRFQGVQAGGEEAFVLVFPAIKITQGDRVLNLAGELRQVPVAGGGTIHAAGEAMILADMLTMVFNESKPILIMTLVLVLATMWLLLGRLRLALLCLLPAGITLLAGVGLAPYLGLQFNYLNIVMIPLLVGMGVDGGVHLVTQLDEGRPLQEILERTAPPVYGAILTTVFGFGTTVFAHHPGLRSLGEFAVVGMSVNLLACLVGLPAFIAVLQRFARVRSSVMPWSPPAADQGTRKDCQKAGWKKAFGVFAYCPVSTRARTKPTS
jgi:predicted RND superfamily exporter protein